MTTNERNRTVQIVLEILKAEQNGAASSDDNIKTAAEKLGLAYNQVRPVLRSIQRYRALQSPK